MDIPSNSAESNTTSHSNPFQPADDNDDDDIPPEMSASYSEISFHGVPENYEKSILDSSTDYLDDTMKSPPRPSSLGYALFPLDGTVSVDGSMTSFVAENLEYKIKLASPVLRKESSLTNSRTSTPSQSHVVPRQFIQQSQFNQQQQIDIDCLNDIEIEAQYLAASVDNLTENLCNLLHSVSSITADNVECYKNSVNKLTDCMDSNIKSMYTIMAKTEEISNAMRPTVQLSTRIREIRRLVDMMEINV
ncbi:BLOC-1-related complex subunit 6 isoform X2 [Bradysia coprophila]|uniref:BLOC-1-related complex subunit 6 isoform X2 n=1 Tax=Bradysia coprophila TaxID=38358 RepID=UPI00187D8710|nr:BLOC-1-related complex subunit 6 isoform X2 [Bradysia coprophila]